jgi:head-tail adaptor
MNQAGKYSEAFTLLSQTITKDADGTPVEAFPPQDGTLWGSLEPSEGEESKAYSAMTGQSIAVIRLRQFPPVRAVDRLLHKRSGLTYDVTGRYTDYPNNETVLQCTVFDVVVRADQ